MIVSCSTCLCEGNCRCKIFWEDYDDCDLSADDHGLTFVVDVYHEGLVLAEWSSFGFVVVESEPNDLNEKDTYEIRPVRVKRFLRLP